MITGARRTGLLGEIYAARYLRRKGYEIWSANYRTRAGEIDIVAFDGKMICFVEVKTRSPGAYFPPSEAVDYKKEENVKSAAAAYLSMLKTKYHFRFDIIEVILEESTHKIRHIENAF